MASNETVDDTGGAATKDAGGTAKKDAGGAAKKDAGGAATKTVTVEQFRSANRRPKVQEQTLRGLGLNKLNRRRTLADTPAVRGMIMRIRHLVRVVDEKS